MIEAMKQALDVLEYWDVHGKLHQPTEEAITSLRQAIAETEKIEKPSKWTWYWKEILEENEALRKRIAKAEKEHSSVKQEPVAWRGYNWSHSPDDWVYRDFDDPILDGNGNNVGQPLYTSPPQRQWVGLTKKEVHDLYDSDYAIFHQRIEAKLKEKNT